MVSVGFLFIVEIFVDYKVAQKVSHYQESSLNRIKSR